MEASKPSAKIICDSISPDGIRLVTMEVKTLRYLLAEFNTHRDFSRNAASSRAIPAHKIIQRITEDPAMPVHWGAEKKGMQTGESLSGNDLIAAQEEWLYARDRALKSAKRLKNLGLHKSIINRILEPWMFVTDIVSFTNWDNFAWQRCSELAEPSFKATADAMQYEYYTSEPKFLDYGQYHLPYITRNDWVECRNISYEAPYTGFSTLDLIKKISIARCARVSYLTHDGIRDLREDIRLYDNTLVAHNHPSPFEHVATPCRHIDDIAQMIAYMNEFAPGNFDFADIRCKSWGNFFGWHQERKMQPNENRKDFIPNLPELKLIGDK